MLSAVHADSVNRDLAIAPFFGNSIATRLPPTSCDAAEMLLLGGFRAAQRVRLTLQPTELPGQQQRQQKQQGRENLEQQQQQRQSGEGLGGVGEAVHVWLVNMHLDHAEEEQRAVQGQVGGRHVG